MKRPILLVAGLCLCTWGGAQDLPGPDSMPERSPDASPLLKALPPASLLTEKPPSEALLRESLLEDTLPEETLLEGDAINLSEVYRVNSLVAGSIWPGWDQTPFPILLVSDSLEYLVHHESPSSDFEPVAAEFAGQVYARERTYSALLMATFPAVGGVPTVVVGASRLVDRSPTDWVVTVLHEHFHQYQMTMPGYFERVHALDLHGGDESGMWMLNYAFPYDDQAIGALFIDYRIRLHAWLLDDDAGVKTESFEGLRASRRALLEALAPADRRYLEFQSWQEGVARYAEHRVAGAVAETSARPLTTGRPGFVPYWDHANSLRSNLILELETATLSEYKRVAFYALGAAEAFVLDDMRPSWREGYLSNPFSLSPWFDK